MLEAFHLTSTTKRESLWIDLMMTSLSLPTKPVGSFSSLLSGMRGAKVAPVSKDFRSFPRDADLAIRIWDSVVARRIQLARGPKCLSRLLGF